MRTALKQQIIALAIASPTQEICGLIYATEFTTEIHTCPNVAADPANEFEIDQNDWFACLKLGKPIAVYHSHPVGPAAFSPADLAAADEYDLPLYLYDLASQIWLEYLPCGYSVPLEGRRFTWGFDDCYGTCRHYYRQKLPSPLYLRDYDRDTDFDITNSNAIVENLGNEGFVQLAPTTSIQLHDALLFNLNRRAPQHLTIFVGNQCMLHHPLNALSKIDLLDGRWIEKLESVLRHETLL